MFSECKFPRAWTTNIHFTDDYVYILVPQKLQYFREYKNSYPTHKNISAHFSCSLITHFFNINIYGYIYNVQVDTIIDRGSNLEFIVAHVESVPACSKKVGRPKSKASCSCKLLVDSLAKPDLPCNNLASPNLYYCICIVE